MNVSDLHAHFKKLEKLRQSKPQKGFLFYLYTYILPKLAQERKSEELSVS